jgi:hypothetical protein
MTKTPLITAIILLTMVSPLFAQTKAQPKQPEIPPFKEQPPPPGTPGGPRLPSDQASSVERIGPGVYRIGTVVADQKKGTVTVPGSVNMQEGLVELLACGPRGKRHESVLVLDANPHNIQVALLLIGLEPGPGNLEYQGDPRTPLGDPVDILVRFNGPGGRVEKRGEEMILDKPRDKAMETTHWVFTGSKVIDGMFMAAMEQSIVTTFHDPFTIIDNPLPNGGDDTVYYVNSRVVPPVGTPVEVVFQKVKKTE